MLKKNYEYRGKTQKNKSLITSSEKKNYGISMILIKKMRISNVFMKNQIITK